MYRIPKFGPLSRISSKYGRRSTASGSVTKPWSVRWRHSTSAFRSPLTPLPSRADRPVLSTVGRDRSEDIRLPLQVDAGAVRARLPAVASAGVRRVAVAPGGRRWQDGAGRRTGPAGAARRPTAAAHQSRGKTPTRAKVRHHHWLLSSVNIVSILSEHHLFVHLRHI